MSESELRLSVVVVESRAAAPRQELFEVLAPRLEDGSVEVLVVPGREPAPAPWANHPAVRRVACPPNATVPRRRAAGLRAARAGLVALTESFCVPTPGWAEAILAAHTRRRGVAVGGPVDRRAGTPAEWALTLCEYGRFLPRQAAGRVEDLAGVNVAYDRERLIAALGDLPEEILEVELHAELRRRGAALWWEPSAVMLDTEKLSLNAALADQYRHGRLFGGRRSAGSGWPARLLRASLAPAVPAVLLSRIAPAAVEAGRGTALARAAPLLLLLLTAWAIGEGVGALAGPGRSASRWT